MNPYRMNNNQGLKKLEKIISQKIIVFTSLGYVTLVIVGFVSLSLFLHSYLAGMVNSQNYSITTQEWRTVTNGIKSGWGFFPTLDGICITRFY
ncbi:MAG: hypothetical protein HY072_02485 [Deltaproteobacteria bacterium]|nr:hypothetical protein [Deltaproteobacteria bacterium]